LCSQLPVLGEISGIWKGERGGGKDEEKNEEKEREREGWVWLERGEWVRKGEGRAGGGRGR